MQEPTNSTVISAFRGYAELCADGTACRDRCDVLRSEEARGELETSPILVRHFSFGWQPLVLWQSGCDLQDAALGKDVEAQLMRGMPVLRDDRPCRGGFLKDAGPPSEVEAVRKLMRGPLVPYVIVYGRWALGEWYGAGGGQSLYHEREGRWRLVESDGGAMGVDYMRKYGVPQPAWCKVGIFDAKCH